MSSYMRRNRSSRQLAASKQGLQRSEDLNGGTRCEAHRADLDDNESHLRSSPAT